MNSRYGYLASVIFVLAFWQVLSLIVSDHRLLPGIFYVLRHSLPSIAQFAGHAGEDYGVSVQLIAMHTEYTLVRLIVGLIVGTVSGIIAGMVVHFFHSSKRANAIILAVIRSVPLFALIPLFLYWFGVGLRQLSYSAPDE